MKQYTGVGGGWPTGMFIQLKRAFQFIGRRKATADDAEEDEEDAEKI